METQYALIQVGLGIIGALLAVGAVLFIKITRRRQAARGISDPSLPTGVATDPMSRSHADRLVRAYLWSAGVLLALLLFAGLWVL